MMIKRTDLLKMKLPEDLKKLNTEECREVCSEVRRILIETVSKNGGHLASSLGTVELALAIHRVFHSPDDKIIWDVGHQAYAHKIFTGRLPKISTLRKENGLCGFCRPDESEHDAFVSGHSSNSVSAALGIAAAMKIQGLDDNYAVAVVGDGAATGGMIYEGLNNAGKSNTNMIIILNHNEMSISRNVGSFAKYLSTLRTKTSYRNTKTAVENALNRVPMLGAPVANSIRRSKNAFKDMLLHSTMFEDLGLEYIGPIDGHNLTALETGLKSAKALKAPVLVHIDTIKGKGYAPAEEHPSQFHGIGKFEIETGNPDVVPKDSYSTVFGTELARLAYEDSRICAVTAAMLYGTGLQYFAKQHPKRFFDVGIAEEHAVTFCGGLASMGMLPVFAVYSSFLQRGYDQLIHDLSICKTHAVIGVDRAGLVGEDGETHHGIFDVGYLTTVPDITVYSPATYSELKLCLQRALFQDNGLCAVRYPRGCDRSADVAKAYIPYDYTNNNGRILLCTYGRIHENMKHAVAILAKQGIAADFLKLVKIYPLEPEIHQILDRYEKIYFFEEAYVEGSISQKLQAQHPQIRTRAITGFIKQATTERQMELCGLSAEKMAEFVSEDLRETD